MNKVAGSRRTLTLMTLAVVIAGGVLTAVLTDGPPDVSASDGAQAAASGGEETDMVTISDFKFIPPDVTVPAGTTLTFVDKDDSNHNATARDGSFETGNISGGDEGSVELDTPGTYDFYCTLHPFMTGTVTVTQ